MGNLNTISNELQIYKTQFSVPTTEKLLTGTLSINTNKRKRSLRSSMSYPIVCLKSQLLHVFHRRIFEVLHEITGGLTRKYVHLIS